MLPLPRLLTVVFVCVLAAPVFAAEKMPAPKAPPAPTPTFADVPYGPDPHEIMDIHVPKDGAGPFPVVLWFGGIWEANKHAPDLNRFFPRHIAVIAVETRTLPDGQKAGMKAPVEILMRDAIRVVQFVRLHAAEWKIDPARIAVAGGSQGTLPALYVGCAGEQAKPASADPVERVSSLVRCVGAWRSQPSIDPKQMQEWVPGVEWGAPALGYDFKESLKRRDELLPAIRRWSPDALLHQGAAPIYFEYDWSLEKPADPAITETNYRVHSPAWGLGFQKLAKQAGVECYVKFPGRPTEEYADIWDFMGKKLQGADN